MANREAPQALLDLASQWAKLYRAEGFPLASGERSPYYFDVKRVTLAPEAIAVVGELVYDTAKALAAQAVGGLAAGSIPISDAAMAWAGLHGDFDLRSFYVRDGAKEHGTEETVYTAFSHDGRDLLSPGRKVLVVDDVLTTGRSIQKAIDQVESRSAELVGVLVLIDRQDPAGEPLRHLHGFRSILEMDAEGNLRLSERLLAPV
ncbi:MAG: phosphoribosyltransferase family protein [Dehalococcoidia bacterium]